MAEMELHERLRQLAEKWKRRVEQFQESEDRFERGACAVGRECARELEQAISEDTDAR